MSTLNTSPEISKAQKGFLAKAFEQARTNNWQAGWKSWDQNFKSGISKVLSDAVRVTLNFHKLQPMNQIGKGLLYLGIPTTAYLSVRNNLSMDTGIIAAEAVGFAGALLLKAGGQMDNRQRIAVDTPAAVGLFTQAVAHGGTAYAVMMGVKAARSGLYNFIPESSRELRLSIGLASFGIGATAITTLLLTGVSPLPLTALAFSPLISMGCGTASDFIKSENSRYSRAINVASDTLHVFHNIFHVKSLSATASALMGIVGITTKIGTNDVPTVINGEKVSRIKGLQTYFTRMANGTPTFPEEDKIVAIQMGLLNDTPAAAAPAKTL